VKEEVSENADVKDICEKLKHVFSFIEPYWNDPCFLLKSELIVYSLII